MYHSYERSIDFKFLALRFQITFNYELVEDMYVARSWNGGTVTSDDNAHAAEENRAYENPRQSRKNSSLWVSSSKA